MTGEEFFAALKAGSVGSLYLFEGEEEYVKEQALKQLRALVLRAPFEAMNENVLLRPGAETLINACETLPLMADKRLVVVKDSSLFDSKASGESEQDRILEYIKRLPETTCLVFFHRGAAGKARKAYKYMDKQHALVTFDLLDHRALTGWIAREMKGAGLAIGQDACEAIIFNCGRELLLIRREVDKLIAYAAGEGAVTLPMVEAVCVRSAEAKAFELSNLVAERQGQKAIWLLEQLLKNGESAYMLLSLLQRQYRQLYLTAGLTAEGSAQDAASLLGVAGFVVKKLADIAGKYETKVLKQAYFDLIQTEYDLKTGRLKEDGIAETAVLKLMTLERKTR